MKAYVRFVQFNTGDPNAFDFDIHYYDAGGSFLGEIGYSSADFLLKTNRRDFRAQLEDYVVNHAPSGMTKDDVIFCGMTDGLFAVVGSTTKYDVFPTVKSVTISGGNAVFYLTDDGTSTGNALYSDVYLESLNWTVWDNAGLYAIGTPTISGNKKTLTVPVQKQGFSGVTILGINVLGSVAFTAASGPTMAVSILGKAA